MENEEKDSTLDLLKFNYQNLHNAVWQSHKVAWTMNGFFISAIFALMGYLTKAHFRASITPEEFIGGLVISEILVLFWWLMIGMLELYNRQRIVKLRQIERAFAGYAKCEPDLVQHYGGFSYRRRGKLIAVSWNWIYKTIAILITVVNVLLLTHLWKGGYGVLIGLAITVIIALLAVIVRSVVIGRRLME